MTKTFTITPRQKCDQEVLVKHDVYISVPTRTHASLVPCTAVFESVSLQEPTSNPREFASFRCMIESSDGLAN
eukprot:500843-Amphidinium_carterae.1